MTYLYVDSGCNKQTGLEAWASVVNQDGCDVVPVCQDLFTDLTMKIVQLPKGERIIAVSCFTDVQSQQNNGGELLALVMGLRIAQNYQIDKIYSDSQLVVKTWSKNGPAKKTEQKMDPRKLKYIRETIHLRKDYESRGGQVIQISGDDNLADLGYHK